MSRDGSGTYSLPQAAFTSGTTIESAKVNSNFSDIAAGLTQSISKDGQTTYTANQPMGGFKFTGLAAGASDGDSVRYEQLTAINDSIDTTNATALIAARGLLAGCQTSNNSGAPNTKIDVTAGSFTDDTNSQIFSISAGSIDFSTTGANALDTGSLANSTTYHLFCIGKTDGTTALLGSASLNSPTMPSGYTLKRRIWSVVTDGSAHIRPYVQNGDNGRWKTPVNDYTNVPGVTTRQSYTLTVPLGLILIPDVYIAASTGASNTNVQVWVSSLDETDVAPDTSNFHLALFGTGALNLQLQGIFFNSLHTDTSGRIGAKMSNADGGLRIKTHGWTDRRGRDA